MKYQAIDSDYIREMKERDEFLKQKGYMLKGVKYGYFIAIIIIILSALFNGNLVLAIGEVDISYEFESDELYNETDFSEATNFNIRNQTEYTGHYNATYSFENEIGLNSTAISFIDSEVGGAGIHTIISEYEGHSKVLNQTNEGTHIVYAINTLDFLVSEGTIEFWIYRTEVATSNVYIYPYDDQANLVIRLYSTGDDLFYRDELDNTIDSGYDFIINQWTHISIDFETTTDTFQVRVNGIEIIDDFYLGGSIISNISEIKFATYDATNPITTFYDAIGYSWDIDYNTSIKIDIINIADGNYVSGDETDTYVNDMDYYIVDYDGIDTVLIFIYMDAVVDGNLSFYMFCNTSVLFKIYVNNSMSEFASASGTEFELNHLYINNASYFRISAVHPVNPFQFSLDHFEILSNATIGYNIGDNLVPYSITNTSIQETNAYEFSFTEAGIYTESEATPPFWTEIESSTYVQGGYFRIFDDTSATTDLGLYKDDFSITSGIIDVSMVFEYEHSSTEEAVFYLKLISADTTEIVRLRMYSHLFDANTINTLSYWNGTTYNNITTLVKDVIYSINVFINGRMVILSLDGIKISIFETLADKDGLSEVRFHGNGGQYGDGIGQNRYVEFKIYSIGVYSEGISVSNDYYSSFISTTLDWDSNEYNFFTADIVGNCSIVVGSTVAIGSPHTLFAYREFNGVEMKNVYDEFTGGNEVEGWVALQDFNLTITSNTTIILNSMEVSGFKLTEGLNTYYMDLTSSGIDVDNSYFYVLGGRLYFSLTTDDSNLEYMEATFVIPNIPSFERGLDWSGVKSGSSLEAQFKVNYIDSSFNPFTLTPAYKDLAVLLPQDKTITSFSLLISDNDNDINDTITGSIGSFDLIYIPLIETDFVSISFFDALPIVILVVVIPIALYYGFGRKKELLVPSIIAMSIFGTAIGLIPLWLTFVIGFGCVSYFIMDRRN